MIEHLTIGFHWGSPQELVEEATNILEKHQREAWELVSAQVLSGYCLLFLKRLPLPPTSFKVKEDTTPVSPTPFLDKVKELTKK